MCVVSMVGDHYSDRFNSQPYQFWQHYCEVKREEFDALKAEVEEMKELLIAAKKIDEVTGQPDCEMEEKIELLKKVAEAVGVDLEEVFGDNG